MGAEAEGLTLKGSRNAWAGQRGCTFVGKKRPEISMDCQLFLKLAMNTNISELQCVATPHRANSTGTDGQFVLCGGARSTCPVSVKAEEAGRGQGG